MAGRFEGYLARGLAVREFTSARGQRLDQRPELVDSWAAGGPAAGR